MSIPIYKAEGIRAWDAYTIAHEPIASIDLMERAASLACKDILGRNLFDSAAIFCGPGNNGGDGLVIARLLHEAGKSVRIFLLKFGERSEDFQLNLKRLPSGVSVIELTETSHAIELSEELIVDAIFGSGLNGGVDGWIGEVISSINQLNKRLIAIDIPSGLMISENQRLTQDHRIIRADETLSFMAPKMPFFFPEYASYVGKFRSLNIGLSLAFIEEDSIARYVESSDIAIKGRSTHAHKGTNGFLSLIGGLEEMTGAVVIAAEAAVKSGAGYVNVISNKDAKLALNIRRPEVVWQNAVDFELINKTTAIAIGPGLGTGLASQKLVERALVAGCPLVVDADAINLIAENKVLKSALPADTILTPHIGELKRLLGPAESSEALLKLQQEFSIEHKVFVIQKGPYSKLSTPDGKLFINSTGNPGMGTAGMGDAMTGIIGALLAQGYTAEQASIYGMYLHGYAADEQEKNVGEIGLTASDVIALLPAVINKFIRT